MCGTTEWVEKKGEVMRSRMGHTRLAERCDVLKSTYVPPKLPHRGDMIAKISKLLGRAMYGSAPPDLLITGRSGSGKTVTIGKVIEIFRKRKGCVPIAYTVAASGPYKTLRQLAIGCGIDIDERGLSLDEGWEKFNRMLKDSPRIFILDEVDQTLQRGGERLLYFLSRRPNTCTVCISNRIDVLAMIEDTRVRSSFTPRMKYFPPYDATQLGDILRDRVKIAKAKIRGDAINLCAALAVEKARNKGDVRYALSLLNSAVDIAESVGANRVCEEHVRAAEEEVEDGMVLNAISSLKPPEKLLMLSVISSGPQPTTTVYIRTNEIAKNSGKYRTYSHRMLYNFLSDLKDQGFVRTERRGREYGAGRGGSTWKVRLTEGLPLEAIDMIKSTKGN